MDGDYRIDVINIASKAAKKMYEVVNNRYKGRFLCNDDFDSNFFIEDSYSPIEIYTLDVYACGIIDSYHKHPIENNLTSMISELDKLDKIGGYKIIPYIGEGKKCNLYVDNFYKGISITSIVSYNRLYMSTEVFFLLGIMKLKDEYKSELKYDDTTLGYKKRTTNMF